MRFQNKAKKDKDMNFAKTKETIPKSIRDKISEYKPTEDMQEIEYIEFKEDLSAEDKQTLLAQFPELKLV